MIVMMTKNKCDKECIGTIKEIKLKGSDFPRVLVVEYKVNNRVYELKENLVMKKDKNIKLGFIPIGYKTKSLIEIKTGIPAIAGNKIKVKYCSTDPNIAFLPDNDSKIT